MEIAFYQLIDEFKFVIGNFREIMSFQLSIKRRDTYENDDQLLRIMNHVLCAMATHITR